MVVESSTKTEVFWVGTPLEKIPISQLAHRNVSFYKKCIFGPLSIQVGDFVLISNADYPEPDTVLGCDVAKVLHLYEIDDEMSPKDPCRAIVQWYSRPQAIPHRFYDSDEICIDFDIEVIEDYRPYEWDVSVETIFSKCIVVQGKPSESPIGLIENTKKGVPMFVCRYKFLKVKNKYKLIPLDEKTEDNARNNDKRSSRSNVNNPKSVNIRTPRSAKKVEQDYLESSVNHQHCIENSKIPEIEFFDINSYKDSEKQEIVSPIKIVKNTVIKMPKNGSEYSRSLSAGKEVNANYLTESPGSKDCRNTTPLHKVSGARRNLNISLDNEANSTADSDILNYSIIKNTPDKSQINDMKIKLRISDKKQQHSNENISESKQCGTRITLRSSRDLCNKELPTRKRSVDEEYSFEGGMLATPTKKIKNDCIEKTPSTKGMDTQRRKSILKTPGGRTSTGVGTPKRNIQLSNIVEEMLYNENSAILTPSKRGTPRLKKQIEDEDFVYEAVTPRKRKSLLKTPQSSCQVETPTRKVKLKADELTPTIHNREKLSNRRKSDLQIARERLHVSAVPESLPCREIEFDNIYTFLEGKIQDKCGGCMYVSGVPGTGKTATVTGVIRHLQRQAELEQIPEFDFIEINGMKLTEPRQAYVQIYKQLTGKTVSSEHAHSLLEKRFTTPAPRRTTTVLLVDELDILCNRRQDVVYNLLDWPTKAPAKLVVITIANTMDLPERLLMGKVTSRLGLTRLTFQPYSHKQLQQIVTARLGRFDGFKDDAVQLVARKVAAVSGDARRALDICRRATEIAEESCSSKGKGIIVNMSHVSQALGEMIASAKVQAIKSCSKLEQIFLQAVSAEVTRRGVEETNFMGVYTQIESMAAFMGLHVPNPGQALRICSKLGAERLLICEHSRTDLYQKILLNVSTDDIHYALQVNVN